MNIRSYEYGILVTGCSYSKLKKIFPVEKGLFDGFATFNGKDIETHPWNPKYIFVSYGDAKPGKAIPKHRGRVAAFQKILGNAGKAKWGVIETER
jgi:hypothetical protein